MNSNHTSLITTRKGFLSFGVLSSQNRPEQPALTMQPKLEKKVQQVALEAWKLRRYET